MDYILGKSVPTVTMRSRSDFEDCVSIRGNLILNEDYKDSLLPTRAFTKWIHGCVMVKEPPYLTDFEWLKPLARQSVEQCGDSQTKSISELTISFQ